MSTYEKPYETTIDARIDDELVVSVVIPCLNEADNIERCVTAALGAMHAAGIPGEVVVADNASEDRSAELATAAGARVVHEPRRGYGSAYLAGFAAAVSSGDASSDTITSRSSTSCASTDCTARSASARRL